jgi:uridine kinase
MAKNPKIILIDGPAGSGKTTLSLKLQDELQCEVIHLDDHYNGWDEALEQGLSNTLLTILNNFSEGKACQVATFDWHKYRFDGYREIQPAEALIIEGVGAGQSLARKYATTLYWVEAEPEIAFNRVLDRDGLDYENRIREWQIREAKHFIDERTREFADFIIITT